MRISDWSSDVCSSDLVAEIGEIFGGRHAVGQQDGRNTTRHKVFQVVQAAFDVETRVVGQLFCAEDLYARGVDQVQVANQIGARHAQIGYKPMGRAKAGDPGKCNFIGVVDDKFLDGEHGGRDAMSGV